MQQHPVSLPSLAALVGLLVLPAAGAAAAQEDDLAEEAASPSGEAAPSEAPPTSPFTVEARIDRAQKAIDGLDYQVAADELMIAVDDPNATDDQLIQANLMAGIVNRILDRNVEARLHFLYVLSRAPETQLDPDLPPKIRSFFNLVRREREADLESRSARVEPGSDVNVVGESAPPEDAEFLEEEEVAFAADDTDVWIEEPGEGIGALGIVGLLLLGGSALVGVAALFGAVGSGTLIALTEATLSIDRSLDFEDRVVLQQAGRAALVGAGLFGSLILLALAGGIAGGGLIAFE